jgi:hypothetical protein
MPSLYASRHLPRYALSPEVPIDLGNKRFNRLAQWFYHSGTEPMAMLYDAHMTNPAGQYTMVPPVPKPWQMFKWPYLMSGLLSAWRSYWVPWFKTVPHGFVQKQLRRLDQISADTL